MMRRIRQEPKVGLWLGVIGAASGLSLAAAYLAVGMRLEGAGQQSVHPFVLSLVLVVVSLGLGWWAVGSDRRIFSIFVLGLCAKIAGTYLRFTILSTSGDAVGYNGRATRIVGWMAEAPVALDDPRIQIGSDGTRNLTYAVAWLYRFIGPGLVGGTVAFSFLSLTGVILVFRAASLAIPELDKQRFAIVLFLLPSMLFWPSSLGKDAWMVLAIGIVAVGAAGAVRRFSPGHLAMTLVGIAMAGWVRPHMGALLTIAMVAAVAIPEVRKRSGRWQQLFLVAFGLIALVLSLNRVQDVFGTEGGLAVGAVLEQAESRTSEGGSEFEALPVTNPIGFLRGLPGVLLRPFPNEADSVAQLLTSFEGIGILALTVGSWKRIRLLPRVFLRNGLVRLATIYLVGFVVAFSVISNFGILARQRSQLWPMFLVLICLKARDPVVRQSAP